MLPLIVKFDRNVLKHFLVNRKESTLSHMTCMYYCGFTYRTTSKKLQTCYFLNLGAKSSNHHKCSNSSVSSFVPHVVSSFQCHVRANWSKQSLRDVFIRHRISTSFTIKGLNERFACDSIFCPKFQISSCHSWTRGNYFKTDPVLLGLLHSLYVENLKFK